MSDSGGINKKVRKIFSHTLVRFIKDDEIMIIETSNVREFINNSPKEANDFVEKKLYCGRKTKEDKYSSIEIFAIGCKYHFIFDIYYLINLFV